MDRRIAAYIDHFLGFFFIFHVASPLQHLSESSGFSSCSRRQLARSFAKCRCCCPPTVPNSVQTIWPAQNGKNIPRAYTRTKPLQTFAALLGGLPYQADRGTLPPNLVLSTELIMKINHHRTGILKADVSSISPSSERIEEFVGF